MDPKFELLIDVIRNAPIGTIYYFSDYLEIVDLESWKSKGVKLTPVQGHRCFEIDLDNNRDILLTCIAESAQDSDFPFQENHLLNNKQFLFESYDNFEVLLGISRRIPIDLTKHNKNGLNITFFDKE
jgi:hypothetical protein